MGGLSQDFFGQAVEKKAIFLGPMFVLVERRLIRRAVTQCNIGQQCVTSVFQCWCFACSMGRCQELERAKILISR